MNSMSFTVYFRFSASKQESSVTQNNIRPIVSRAAPLPGHLQSHSPLLSVGPGGAGVWPGGAGVWPGAAGVWPGGTVAGGLVPVSRLVGSAVLWSRSCSIASLSCFVATTWASQQLVYRSVMLLKNQPHINVYVPADNIQITHVMSSLVSNSGIHVRHKYTCRFNVKHITTRLVCLYCMV